MLRKDVHISRPQRWDVPFSDQMTTAEVDRLLTLAPFVHMEADQFPASSPLRGILQNDTRIRTFSEGDLIVREGDYGHSAFLILSGAVRVTLEPLPSDLLGRPRPRFWSRLARAWRYLFRARYPEVRRTLSTVEGALGQRRQEDETRIFLQDVPGVLSAYRTLRLTAGEVFGEVAALSRSPRSASVFAQQPTRLLEIRWQGLRDLMRFDPAWRDHIHALYRQNSLAAHLRETPFLKSLSDAQIQALAEATQFESYGDYEWHRPYRSLSQASTTERIDAEPLIAQEGAAPQGLILIRTGFARVSQEFGHGHRTQSYLGKGHVFGLAELYQQWTTGTPAHLRCSLRALGYVDILRIPSETIERLVLPHLPPSSVPPLSPSIPTSRVDANPGLGLTQEPQSQRTSLLEFLVEQRLINGSQTMVIDLNRCTRCDDCVRACAATHDNNPRFVRHGPQFGSLLFASACMHCVDPVCMIGCPTGAIGRNAASGHVTIHENTCIGCGTCASSCPYSAIRMVEVRDHRGKPFVDATTQMPIQQATKCDFCQGGWGGPACQRACPHDALIRIDLQQPFDLFRWLDRSSP